MKKNSLFKREMIFMLLFTFSIFYSGLYILEDNILFFILSFIHYIIIYTYVFYNFKKLSEYELGNDFMDLNDLISQSIKFVNSKGGKKNGR